MQDSVLRLRNRNLFLLYCYCANKVGLLLFRKMERLYILGIYSPFLLLYRHRNTSLWMDSFHSRYDKHQGREFLLRLNLLGIFRQCGVRKNSFLFVFSSRKRCKARNVWLSRAFCFFIVQHLLFLLCHRLLCCQVACMLGVKCMFLLVLYFLCMYRPK